MDIKILLDFVPQEKLIKFLRCKKTEICSYVNDPRMFLQILRDHELIPDDHYQKVMKRKGKQRMQENLYEVLDWLANERGQMIKQFWSCVFQEHILQKYPLLRQLQNSLLNEYFLLSQNLPWVEKLTGNEEKQVEQKKCGTKRKKSVDETEEEDAGPSSVSSSSQEELLLRTIPVKRSSEKVYTQIKKKKKRLMMPVKTVMTSLKQKPAVLPVSCGSVRGDLYKSRFAGGSRNKSIHTEER
ncbi:nuclear body protein SP140-like protein isoform X1 [Tachysurus ichikawai]